MHTIKITTERGPWVQIKSEEMPSAEEILHWHRSMSKHGHVTMTVDKREHVFRTEDVNGFTVHILTPGHAVRMPDHPEFPFAEVREEVLL